MVCSVVFWLGDLNYRISDIEPEDCKQMITKGELEHLLRNNDQVSALLYSSILVQLSLSALFFA